MNYVFFLTLQDPFQSRPVAVEKVIEEKEIEVEPESNIGVDMQIVQQRCTFQILTISLI